MKVKVLAFGIAKDIFGSSTIEVELLQDVAVSSLQGVLEHRYPRLQQLTTYRIAINDEYVSANRIIHSTDEIAVIPPVSGG